MKPINNIKEKIILASVIVANLSLLWFLFEIFSSWNECYFNYWPLYIFAATGFVIPSIILLTETYVKPEDKENYDA